MKRDLVVLRAQAGVGDARHDHEALVGVRDAHEVVRQVLQAGDAVVLAAHDHGRYLELFRRAYRQVGRHVEVGTGGYRRIELEHRIGEHADDALVGGARVVAGEDAFDHRAVDRPALVVAPLIDALAALGQGRAALAGPDEGVERDAPDAFRLALGEQRGTQCARRGAVHQQLRVATRPGDVLAHRSQIVGTVGDVAIDVTRLGRTPVAFVVQAPGVVAQACEAVHHRILGLARHLQVEYRGAGHRGPMHEQERAAGRRAFRACQALAPHEQPDGLAAGLARGPVLGPGHLRQFGCAAGSGRGPRRWRDSHAGDAGTDRQERPASGSRRPALRDARPRALRRRG